MTSRALRRVVAFASLVLAVAHLSGCAKDFAGPYPCNTDFASCTTADRCETNLASDPEHCGACGAACPQASVCVDKQCSAAPPVLATAMNPSAFAANAKNLYWSSSTSIGLTGISKRGGAEFAVSTPNAWQQNGATFAVDDADVYYFGQGNGGPGPNPLLIEAAPLAPSAMTPRVLGELPSQSMSGRTSLVLSGDSLFLGQAMSTGPNSSLTVMSVPKTGGSLGPVTTFPNANQGFVVDASNVYASVMSSPCEIDRAPVSGGDPVKFASTQSYGCASTMTGDGSALYFASNYTQRSYDSNNDNNGGVQQCVIEVGSAPLGGGAPSTLATIAVDEGPLQMVVDASGVYLATNKSVWRIPVGGGTATRVAGNLGVLSDNGGNKGPGNGCTFSGNFGGPTAPVALALDDANLYVGVVSIGTQTGVLYRIAKQ